MMLDNATRPYRTGYVTVAGQRLRYSVANEGCGVPAGGSRQPTDCDDGDGAVNPAATEVCDGADNDCDGSTDPGCSCTDGSTRPCGQDDGGGGDIAVHSGHRTSDSPGRSSIIMC